MAATAPGSSKTTPIAYCADSRAWGSFCLYPKFKQEGIEIPVPLPEIAGMSGTCGSAEFVCSRKRFGPDSNKFTDEQQPLLLDRMRAEVGVYVDVIDIPGTSEKGVDTTIAGRLHDLEGEVPAAVLVYADCDYIPTLRKLRHKLKMLLLSVNGTPPTIAKRLTASLPGSLSPEFIETQASYAGFADWPLEKQIAESSVIVVARYGKDGDRYTAIISDILKQGPDVQFYYKAGAEYAQGGYYPKEGLYE